MSKFVAFMNDESGASAAEYALILAVIGVAIFGAMTALSGGISERVNKTANCLKTPTSTACA